MIKYIKILLFVGIVSWINNSYGVEGELIIHNENQTTLNVKIFPVGAIFNGNKKYKLRCENPFPNHYDFIFGGEANLSHNGIFRLDHDGDLLYCCESDKAIGYGKYKIEFYQNGFFQGYCYVDFSDSDYPYVSGFIEDLHIYYYSGGDIRPWNTSQSLPSDTIVKIWDQRVINPNSYKMPNKNGFVSDAAYTDLPINAVDSGAINHINPNEFYVNYYCRCWCSQKFARSNFKLTIIFSQTFGSPTANKYQSEFFPKHYRKLFFFLFELLEQ